MDSEEFAGGAAVSFGALDGTSNDGFLENLDGFLQEESAFEQVVDEPFKCLFHRESLNFGVGQPVDAFSQHIVPDAFHLAVASVEVIL